MHVPINVKSPNNISKWQMGFNSTFKRLKFNHAGQWLTSRIKPNSFLSMLNVTVVTKHFCLPPKTAESPLHTAFPVDKHDRLRDASTGSKRKASEIFLLLEFQAWPAADGGSSENVALLYTEFSNYDAKNMLLIAGRPN